MTSIETYVIIYIISKINLFHINLLDINIKLSDFEEKNNSLFSNYSEQISEMQEKLDTLLSHFDNKNSKEGGNIKNMFDCN